MEQMLETPGGRSHYCFIDGYLGYIQVPIAPEGQEKTTFPSALGSYAFRRMPFGLCNALATFQRYMMRIFSDFITKIMEVSWMILLFMVILLISACIISL